MDYIYVALCKQCWEVVAASVYKGDVLDMLAPDRIIVMVEQGRKVAFGDCTCHRPRKES